IDLQVNRVQHQRGQHHERDVLGDELETEAVCALADVVEAGAHLGKEVHRGAAHQHRAPGEGDPEATDPRFRGQVDLDQPGPGEEYDDSGDHSDHFQRE